MKKNIFSILTGTIFSIVATQGLDYIMVGDFGWTFDMTNTQINFDAINAYVGNITANGGKINFLMTMGDNLYTENDLDPT